MAEAKIDGLGVALVTPFREDLSIDYKSLGTIIEHIISGGCDYIVVLGTTAETPTLSLREKEEVARFICDITAGRVPLVIGIGGNNTKGVIDDIKSRNLTGYSAILSVTPYYNKPTQEGLFQHFKAIAEASPLPILLYNVPGRTGVNLTAKTTLRLARFSDKFCGIKEASGKLDQCEEIIKDAPAHFKVISGDDALVSKMMRIGGKGVISVIANAYPALMKEMVEDCQNSRRENADTCQEKLLPLIRDIFEDGNPAGVKAILAKMGMIRNVLRLPLVSVSKEVEKKLEKEMGFIGHSFEKLR